jgi:Flp pilus assembly protein TadG
MIEFTLSALLLISIFLGTVSFGQDIHMYNRLEESVRAGARFASLPSSKYDAYGGLDPRPAACAACDFTPTSGPYVTSVRNMVAYGCDPAAGSATGCTQVPVVEGVLPANVTVTLRMVNSWPKAVTVSMRGVSMTTPLGRVVLNGKPVTSFPWMAVYMPPPPA